LWLGLATEHQYHNWLSHSYIPYNNETKTLVQWAETYNLNPTTLRKRLKNGWSVEKALITPLLS